MLDGCAAFYRGDGFNQKGDQSGLYLSRVISSRWLLALLLLTFLKGWVWAAVFPPFQPSDELHHIGYARDIARYETLSVKARDIFTPEEVVAMEIARLVEVSGYRQPLDLSPERIRAIDQARVLLRSPAEQPSPAPSPWVKFFSRHHPPLYYALGAVLEWVLRPPDLIEHLALGRLLSVLFSVATVGLTYLLAQEVFPLRPPLWLAAAVMVSFLPMVTYLGAVYTNQALELTFFTALFWLIARVLRLGLTWSRAFWFGLLLGLGLMTKVSFLVALPLVVSVALYDLWRAKGKRPAWIVVLLLPALLAGPWYVNYLGLGNGGLVDTRAEAAGCPSLPIYLMRLPIRSLLLHFWNESVAAFGHRDSLFPRVIYQVSLATLALAIAGWGRQLYWTGSKDKRHRFTSHQWFMGGIFLLAWLGIIAFYFLIGYLVSCDQRGEYAQGRLIVPVAAGSTLLLLMGWLSLVRRRHYELLALLIIVLAALNTYALVNQVIWRYYGSQQEVAINERDLLSVPLNVDQGVSQCFAAHNPGLNRVDIWLEKEQGGVSGELQLELINAGRRRVLSTSRNTGWVTTYPAYFQFAPLATGEQLCLAITGRFDKEVRVWATNSGGTTSWVDGNEQRAGTLAIHLYRPVPWYAIPERMGVQSSAMYTPHFYWAMGAVYAFTLILFLLFLLRWLLLSSRR